jgi:hypothetical protein
MTIKTAINPHDDEITQKGVDVIVDFYRTLAISEKAFANAVAFVTGVDSPALRLQAQQKK